jgi:hypothetical protein
MEVIVRRVADISIDGIGAGAQPSFRLDLANRLGARLQRH